MSELIAKEGGLNRRMAMKVMVALGLASTGVASGQQARLETKPNVGPAGTLSDPELKQAIVPWERTLSEAQLATLAVLCDLILPADRRSPSASQLGAHEFIDEWVSAPYERQVQDRGVLLDGLDWLDGESNRRFGSSFVNVTADRRHQICQDICNLPDATEPYRLGARFFALVRDLTATAFWTTQEGMDDLGYVGNVPLPKWEAPPKAVLEHLGLK